MRSLRRLLLLLSDGRPEDYDDGGDRRYLHEDTRMAVKEAVACGVQYAGLLAERWFFFAQARHPQNLYYQAIS